MFPKVERGRFSTFGEYGSFFRLARKFRNFFLDKDMPKMIFACDSVGNLDLLL